MKKSVLFTLGCLLLFTGCGERKENYFNNPNINTIKNSLTNIKDISSICMVTPNHDPNGNLNDGKGGYNGALYFTHFETDVTSESDTQDACDKGVTYGGSIETYENTKDAKKRYDYLISWGKTAGYTHQKGKVIIRLSTKFSADEEKKLYDDIIKSLEATQQ